MAARIGLVVRSAPEAGRSLRDTLDMALAAAALEHELCLVFTAAGLRQLVGGRQPTAAGLPPGLKAWRSLDELTDVEWLAPATELARWDGQGVDWLVSPRGCSSDDLRAALAACDRVWTA